MRAQGRRVTNGPVWAAWFLELEELLDRRETPRSRSRRSAYPRRARSSK